MTYKTATELTQQDPRVILGLPLSLQIMEPGNPLNAIDFSSIEEDDEGWDSAHDLAEEALGLRSCCLTVEDIKKALEDHGDCFLYVNPNYYSQNMLLLVTVRLDGPWGEKPWLVYGSMDRFFEDLGESYVNTCLENGVSPHYHSFCSDEHAHEWIAENFGQDEQEEIMDQYQRGFGLSDMSELGGYFWDPEIWTCREL